MEDSFSKRMVQLTKHVKYRDWTITWDGYGFKIAPPGEVKPDSYGRADFIQRFYDFPNVHTTMTDEEVLRRILAYILALEEHEIFEHFQVDGRPVLNPHREPAIMHSQRRDYYVRQVEMWR